MRAPLPPNEEERLEILHALGVLDTPAEAAFDDLALLASYLCGTELAAITLLDRDRQWIKAGVGHSIRETSRDDAFCAHTILDPFKVTVVEDACVDPRFEDNPAVRGPIGIRFYAGAPILTAEGLPVGVISVAGTEPRGISDEQRRGLTALARQVSAQLELRRAVVNLRHQAEELAVARDAAVAAGRAKSDFLGEMGHEIRTPMNGIVGVAELLTATPLSSRQRHYVDTISASAKSLMQMVSRVLAIAETGEDAEPESIRSVVEEIVTIIRPVASAKGLKLQLEVEGGLNAPTPIDTDGLRHVLASLIGGAIQGTDSGAVAVKARREARSVLIEVHHANPSDAPLAESAASGVDRLQATLHMGSGPGGRVAQLRLPAGVVGIPSVLVAEDNEVNSLILASMLEDQGCQVTCVEDGRAAIEAMRRQQFDLVFMDIQMPNLDGVSAARAAREEGLGERTPIVAVTASAVGHEAYEFQAAGIDGLIEKPISERNVVEALRRWLP